jgi:hypothetical protein
MTETCETDQKPKTFRQLIRSAWFWRPVSGVIIGGILGFLYYHYEGCASGTCFITGNPFTSILFGSVMGLFLVNRPCRSCNP